MKQIIFDSRCLLRPATFLEDLFNTFDFLRAVYLLNYSNLSVIRQKGESQNVCFEKTKHARFSKKETILTPWYAHVPKIPKIPLP